jgi:hypothetical protein
MDIGATSSALIGISAAQSQMDAAASAAARSGVIGDAGGGDLVGAMTGAMDAQLSQAVNIAMLRRAMDMQASIIDVIA